MRNLTPGGIVFTARSESYIFRYFVVTFSHFGWAFKATRTWRAHTLVVLSLSLSPTFHLGLQRNEGAHTRCVYVILYYYNYPVWSAPKLVATMEMAIVVHETCLIQTLKKWVVFLSENYFPKSLKVFTLYGSAALHCLCAVICINHAKCSLFGFSNLKL